MTKKITVSLLSMLLLNNVYAAPIELDEVTVEAANRTEQNIKDLTESVTVISAQEIEESRVTTLSQALNRLGNIAMTSNGGPGQSSSMLVRGFDSKRVLVLVDGIRYNDITGLSGAQFSQIMLNDVEHIEIIKGAQSGIWGADASAGVINIVTKKGKKGTQATANVEYGSFATKQASAQIFHKTDSYDFSFGASRYDTRGFSAAEPKSTSADYGKRGDELGWEDDAYVNKTYNAKAAYNLTENDRVEASFRYIDSYIEYDDGAGLDAPNGPYTVNDLDSYFYSAAYKHKDKLNDLALQYSLSRFKRSQYGGYSGDVEEISLQDKIAYAEDSFARVGASYQRYQQQTSAGSDLDKKYNAKSVYATNYNKFLLLEELGSTIFTQSLRYDRYSVFNNKTTGKVGLKQFVHKDIYLSSNYGTAYNIPTLDQLFGRFGTSELSPEETKSLDLTLGNDNLTLTYFYNKVTDMIEWTRVQSDASYNNISGVSRLKGVELGYKDDFFDLLSLGVNYTYLDAKAADGSTLARRPKHQLDGNVFYFITEGLNIGLNGQYIGTRYDGKDNSGAQTGKYALFNTVVNYTINDNFTLYGKIDNITDKYYQVVDGYATAERSYYAGLTAKF
ncbi:MAG: TonB-dependent receptor [Campylobacterales bacterium]|nr:TonB-dependent receptor [Campylobacterales bacterium]